MNIKHRCPCGATIEVTHLSTKEGIAEAQIATATTILQPWLDDHEQHREDAHTAHVGNLERRREAWVEAPSSLEQIMPGSRDGSWDPEPAA